MKIRNGFVSNSSSSSFVICGFKLKNEDENPWYIYDGLVFLSTVGGTESDFAINGVWDSFSIPFSVESQVVKSGDFVELSFELNIEYIVPGKYTESFELVMLPSRVISGTKFDLEFDVLKGNAEIVEIQRTGTGELTVYGCPEHTCQRVSAAKMGEQYVVLETEGRWYKIHIDGVEGWVISNFAKIVE